MNEPLTFLDFFSGVGGFRKGFELCGILWTMCTALSAIRPTGTADNRTIRHTWQAAIGGLPLLCLKGGRCEEIQHYLRRSAVAV